MRIGLLLRCTTLAVLPVSAVAQRPVSVPVEYHKLPNGLKVVLSPDRTAPIVIVAVYYNVGFRLEPRGRTGFAHLFEHLMFQGSGNLGKMEFVQLVQRNGGVLNGSTRFDFTNYFQIVPAHKLETILWAEADRMRGLAITEENLTNQQAVVKNEVKVNVLNQPYGGFPWLDLPQRAFENWFNAHNFYGDFGDLDAATLEDARGFFRTYYAPNNAAVVVVGDFEPRQALALVRRYFAGIPSAPRPPALDVAEPRQAREKRATRVDSLAPRPALALGYQMPQRRTPEHFAMGLIDQILLQGNDSWLYDELVRRAGVTGTVEGGINLLGNMFNYNGPMLWTVSLVHDTTHTADSILALTDRTVARLRDEAVDSATLVRARVKLRSSLYDLQEDFFGFGRADLLAAFALFDDAPARINRLEAEFDRVTPALIQRTAREYLRPSNRTILTVTPAAQPAGTAP
ncbi:MAG TPA: pitrilysin family protein [Gemmatimonadales bacterium]|nr:pitrilysin family protein [Gemmatimonadales bacterium]